MQDIMSNWLSQLSERQGLLKEIQNTAKEYLYENRLPNKKGEAWRLTNTKLVEEIFKLATTDKDQSESNNFLGTTNKSYMQSNSYKLDLVKNNA